MKRFETKTVLTLLAVWVAAVLIIAGLQALTVSEQPTVAVESTQAESTEIESSGPESSETESIEVESSEITPFITFSGETLVKGRTLWLDNCKNCHGDGTAGAPIPMEPEAWQERIAKGKETLYDHAINGFYGPDDTMMPERGGNPELSDEEVKAAVDYVVALANFYIEQASEVSE